MERSKTILTRLAPETERWGWLLLLDVEEDLQYDVYLITRDSTCADVTYNKTETVESKEVPTVERDNNGSKESTGV